MKLAIVTTFNLGKSVVVTIPKQFKPKAGQQYNLTQDKSGLRFNVVHEAQDSIYRLKGSILKYDGPFDPVGVNDWELK